MVGAAAVGIGVGVMRIPEEEHTNLHAQDNKTVKKRPEDLFKGPS
jgi:hypothetical protein